MFLPVQQAFGDLMQRFYADHISPTTPALEEYVARGFSQALAWAPTRMVDQAEAMLAAWQRNDSRQATTRPPDLPVILAAMSKDWAPIPAEFGTQISDSVPIMFPEDAKERLFRVRVISGDIRLQLALFAGEEQTVKSLAAQLLLFLSSPERRRFWAIYPFAGIQHAYPVQFEAPDPPASRVETNSRVVSALIIDLELKASAPVFLAPKPGEPNDGKGTPGTDDPAGYPVVDGMEHEDHGLNLPLAPPLSFPP